MDTQDKNIAVTEDTADTKSKVSKRKEHYGKNRKGGKKFSKRTAYAKKQAYLSSLNDISWYSRNPELLAAASRVPFPYSPGMQIDIPSVIADATNAFDEHLSIPGVFVINFLPTPGYSAGVTSPISIAASELYGRVRGKFSGGLDADAPDMMVYNLALDSVHMYIAHLKRIYHLLSLFATQNRDYPDRVLRALMGNTPSGGFDALRSQKVVIWGLINELVHQVNKFVLPKDMDLYTRHRWMCENVYLDSPNPKGQTYLFRPTHVWKFEMSTESGFEGSSLVPVAIPHTQAFVSDPYRWYQLGVDLISALANWDDGYTISGYYTRAFDGDSLYQAELLQYDEELMPVFVPEVLTQIENAHAVGFVDDVIPAIKQQAATNALIWTPTARRSAGDSEQVVTMNLHSALPTGEEVTIASRLCSYNYQGQLMCGTEAVTSFVMYDADGDTEFGSYPSKIGIMPSTLVEWSQSLNMITKLSHYSRHPVIVAYPTANGVTPTESNTRFYPLGDIDNYTTVAKTSMNEIHKVCTYSEFNCFRK